MNLEWVLYLRGFERLLVVLFGGMSLWLGYRLFMNGVLIAQTASGEFRSAKIQLTKVGPGIFFALFGTAVISISLFRPLSFNDTFMPLVSTNSQAQGIRSFSWGAEMGGPPDIIPAINLYDSLLKNPEFKLPSFFSNENVEKSQKDFQAFKSFIAISKFGTDKVRMYSKERERFLQFPESYSQEDRQTLSDISALMEARYDQ